MSETKFGYDTSAESGSVTVQSPIYIAAMENAMNNLWSLCEFNFTPLNTSPFFKIIPSSFSETIIPIFLSSLQIIAILSVSLYLACFTLKISIWFLHFNERMANAGKRSGVFDRSNLPSSNNSGDFVVIFGSVQTVFPDMPVTIKIIQDSNVVRVAQIEVAKDGTFYESFKASGPYWTNDGTYQISAQYSTMTEVIAFEFYQKMINQSSAAFPISIPNSGSFDVGYTIRGGEVNDMSMNKVRSSLLIETTMISNGNLILKLPRESFDSQKNDGVDDTFII